MAYDMFRKKGLGFAGGGARPLEPAPRMGGGAEPMQPAPMRGGGVRPLRGPTNRAPVDTNGAPRPDDERYKREGWDESDQDDRYKAEGWDESDVEISDSPEDENEQELKRALDAAGGDDQTYAAVAAWRKRMKEMGYSDAEIDAMERNVMNDYGPGDGPYK